MIRRSSAAASLLLAGIGACGFPDEPTSQFDPTHDWDGDGLAEVDGDCDDGDDAIGLPQRYFADADDDRYGDPAAPIEACDLPAGAADNADDCDDSDGDVTLPVAHYADADGDGHGGAAVAKACVAAAGEVDTSDDCDDANPAFYPGAPDACATDAREDCAAGVSDPCRLEGELTTTAADWAQNTGPYTAWRPAATGDLDGDGTPDFALGSGGSLDLPPSHTPLVQLWFDTGVGGDPARSRTLLPLPDVEIIRSWAGAAGDVDGDGTADLLFLQGGGVYDAVPTVLEVLYGPFEVGPDVGVGMMSGTAFYASNAAYGRIGPAFASLADVDADGYGELGFGFANLIDIPESVAVQFGAAALGKSVDLDLAARITESPLATTVDGDGYDQRALFGWTMASLGDVDGDGTPDFAVTSRGDQYAPPDVTVVSGALVRDGNTLPISGVARASLHGGAALAGYTVVDIGPAVVALGDRNGSGYADFAVGFNGTAAEPGLVAIVDDVPELAAVDAVEAHASLLLEGTDETCGVALANLGDTSGLGGPDLAVGCPGEGFAPNNNGAVYVVRADGLAASGTESLATAAAARIGTSDTMAELGGALAGPGDLDGDGFGDLVVGAAGGAQFDESAFVFLGGALP